MSSEKRLALFLVLAVGSMYGISMLMDATGLNPPPVVQGKVDPGAAKPGADAKDKTKADSAVVAKGDAAMPANPFEPGPVAAGATPTPAPAETATPKVARVDQPLILGGDPKAGGKDGYRLEVRLDQRGAAVALATSTVHEGEINRDVPKGEKVADSHLVLIRHNPRSDAPWPLAMTVASDLAADGDEAGPRRKLETTLDNELWEVVRATPDAPLVRPVSRPAAGDKSAAEGQEIAFRAVVDDPAVTVVKTYRIWKGEDGFEVDLKFSGDRDNKFTYTLVGPYGVPIEGEWYTTTFRDVFFGLVKDRGATEVSTRAASDVIGTIDDPSQRFSTLPLKFAGVEDQYFATFLQPWPIPTNNTDRRDHDAGAMLVFRDEKAPQKSDVGVEVTSKPVRVGPNQGETVHQYRVFAGPKTYDALLPYGADELSSYRKNAYFSIPFASALAKNVIAPLLAQIYKLTEAVSRTFGGTKGNYGIAIILLTMCVRLAMFPLGRKQAVMAKKMQDLQPLLTEAREKYKDDKEQLNRETWAIFRANKVNPASGCLPALIQMPIFVGLWQALNNSVPLRHSTFLYIRDLAAPDMLFKFPFELPLIGGWLGPYFNLLPLLVVSLMLVQTKLFSPPPTTPEAEMNQKMMKYIMVVMAFMFYKVPSGLGLYFITSSLWSICERLLVPKILPIPSTALVAGGPDADPDFGNGGGPNKGRGPTPGRGPAAPAAPQGWLGKKLEQLMEEANKQKTIRNDDRDRARDRERDRDQRSRTRPGGGGGGKKR